MTANEAVAKMIAFLDGARIPYMLTGSYASNTYGVARSTLDADFVIQLGQTQLDEFKRRLSSEFELEAQMSFETITATRRFIVRMARPPFTIELFLLSDDPHDRERFARRRTQEFLPGHPAVLPSAEDVIITKVRWSMRGKRQRDREDARMVIAVQATRLDWDYIYRWCDAHGTRALLEELRRSLPPT